MLFRSLRQPRFSQSPAAKAVWLIIAATPAASESAVNFEQANMGSGNDTVIGNSSDNTINGGNGNDSIKGAGGNDTISGGNGNDILQGGAGTDTIYGGNGADIIQVLDGEAIDNVGGGDNANDNSIDTLDLSAITSHGVVVDLPNETWVMAGFEIGRAHV